MKDIPIWQTNVHMVRIWSQKAFKCYLVLWSSVGFIMQHVFP